ncbi:uncharacterized protein J4E87_007963 [Alternaria ethzedia]|uniref:uncharacterized protein n=1 Tax=Alternaria ethzedia TaxID=181014 RepID=UPI0020C5AD43|nr:uncharacterized protein J4E87_007963 [Alternaria ethzedia]KAI4618295.1 hypothetical protein J4E87_007963 [Alternaria ethzedia]
MVETMNTHTSCYTNSILQRLKDIIGLNDFLFYGNIITRVFRCNISGSGSSPALFHMLKSNPDAIFLHNEIATMTKTVLEKYNLPVFEDEKNDANSSRYSASADDSYGHQLFDVVDHFAGTEGARPADAHTARSQVMRCVEMVQQEHQKIEQAVDDVAAVLASMGVDTMATDAMEL